MARIDDRLAEALRQLPAKPPDDGLQSAKKRYSELMSQRLAVAFAQELRDRGLREARPLWPTRRNRAPSAAWPAAWARRRWT